MNEELALIAAIENTAVAILRLTARRGESDDDVTDLREAPGQYYYELETQKRWILGDGGRSGNCELCVENADYGWIDLESTWPNADDIPAHQNCSCVTEEKERRVRYYY